MRRAVVTAAHDTLAALYPALAGADSAQYAAELAMVRDSARKDRGVAAGRPAARRS